MRNSGQNPIAVVVLLLVIVVAIAFAVKTLRTEPYVGPTVDWTCEECGHMFVGESLREPRLCPVAGCGGQAVRTAYYYCSVHRHLFEAYRHKPDPDVDPMKRMGPEAGMLYKFPGDGWTRGRLVEITCPEGNSDPETLRKSPPGAEERRE